ncbi:hypothetical protein CcaCcLH18_13168 [Colletotrichum camelliae]|nr:hypothetical protein CcaCcLH18_13168 [Colletotrichum camelliae]
MDVSSHEGPMPLSGEDERFEQLLEEFGNEHKRRVRSLIAHMKEAERVLAADLNVRHAPISARLKDEEKAKRTLRRRQKDRKQLQDLKELNMEDKIDEAEPFRSVDDMFKAMHDLVGIRISIYFPSDVPKVVEFLQDTFDIQEQPSQKGGMSRDFQKIRKHVERQRQIQEASDNDRDKMELMDRTSSAPEMTFSGYKATHVVVRHKSRDFDQYAANDPDVDIEIQIGSIIMHAWSDIEHDILYKPSATGETSPDVVRMLDLINGIVMTGEVALQQLASVAAAEATRQADDRRQKAATHDFLGPWFYKYFKEQKKAPPNSMGAWSRSMPFLFDVLKARDQHTYGNIERFLKDMNAEPTAEVPLPIRIMQHLGRETWPLQDQFFRPANYTTVWNARYWVTHLVNALNLGLYMGLDPGAIVWHQAIKGSRFMNKRPFMAEFLGLLHPTKPLRLSGREDLMVDFCKAVLQANYDKYPTFVAALRLASVGYVACPRLSEDDEKALSDSASGGQQTMFVPSRLHWLASGRMWWFRVALSSVEEELRDESTMFLASREDARDSGIWKPVKLRHQGQKWDIVYRPFVHTESLEFGNDGAIDYWKGPYAALGLEYDLKVARGINELWNSLELAQNDAAAGYLLVLKDVVGSDAHKIQALIKLTKALKINTAKEVREVAELTREMNTTDADEIKEYRDLLHSLGTKDPEELRALRQLSKENKTTDAAELRKLREEQRISQEAQKVEEEDEDQGFAEPSDSSGHPSP